MAAGHLLNILLMDDLDNQERIRETRIIQRALRDNSDPFNLPDNQFLKYFRLTKNCVHYLVQRLEPFFQEPQRVTAIPIILQILAALHFFGHGSYQFDTGQVHVVGMSQPAVSRSIETVSNILMNHFVAEWVQFPTIDAHVNRIKNRFWEQFHINGCIGAIDCTHIAIIGPPAEHPIYPRRAYFNRKGYTSVNTQIICDADLNILNINARFPGSTHDSAIWMTSTIRRHLEENYINGHNNNIFLLGDSGYPLQPWLLTPIEGAEVGTPEEIFNVRHASTRNCIERLNGVFKSRFRCLLRHRTLNYNPAKAAKIIYSCAVLHNISIHFNIDLPEEDDADNDIDDNVGEEEEINANFINIDRNWRVEGERVRNNVIEEMN